MWKQINLKTENNFAVEVPVKVENEWTGSPFLNNWPDVVFEAELQEEEDAYRIELVIPGVRQGDMHVKAGFMYVDISAEKEEETNKSAQQHGIEDTIYQSFNRRFMLPQIVDPALVMAHYKGGTLTIFIPKPASSDLMNRMKA